jgi:hypothetical protein
LGEVLTTPSRENVLVMNYSQYEMLPLEIKQSGGKLLPCSVLRRGVFPEGVSRSFQKPKRDILLVTWNVRSLCMLKLEGVVGTGWSWLRIGTGGGLL